VEKIGNWQKLDEQLVYDNPWIKVTHENVITPTGTEGIYGKIHFKNIAIGIIPIDDEGNTWIVGQHRYPQNKYSWEIPQGGGSLDQDPLLGAKRELQEETGIIATTWKEIAKLDLSNSVSDEFGHIYIAKNLTFGEANPDDTEELVVKKIPLEELFAKVMDGTFTDSLTVIGALKLKALIQDGLSL